MEVTKAPCPLCGSLIKIRDAEWKCPACNTLNKNWNLFTNCEWCRFGPHFLTCPHCQQDFDLSLLLGNYVDSSGNPIDDSGRRNIRPAIHQHQLGAMNGGFLGKKQAEEAKFFTEEFQSLLADFTFSFPVIVRCFVVHTTAVSPDDRLWLHAWVFASESPTQNEQPQGQLALVYPGGLKEGKKNNQKIDCTINENYW